MSTLDRGLYQLLVLVPDPLSLTVGALGNVRFEAGFWVYTGSAQRNLAARVLRHRAAIKPLRWHIDWLTTACGVLEVRLAVGSIRECAWHQQTARLPGASLPLPGFGSSDCRAGCGAHLTYLGPSAEAWRQVSPTQSAEPTRARPLPTPPTG